MARVGRLQDTLGDKLLPALLNWLGEPGGPAIDNLGKAERFGWIESADVWMRLRRLRNQMIHEDVEDPSLFAMPCARRTRASAVCSWRFIGCGPRRA